MPKFFRIFHQDFENDRMQMQVQMAVDVVQRQAGGTEFFKLRVDFGAELFAQVVVKKIFHARRRRDCWKIPGAR